MWKRFDPTAAVCYVLPCALLFLAVATLVVLPIVLAPSHAKIARFAARELKYNRHLTREELRKLLKAQFIPGWVDRGPDSETGGMHSPCGMSAGVAVQFFSDLRSYIATHLIESRIDKVLDALWSDD